jgi:hypothetical protein
MRRLGEFDGAKWLTVLEILHSALMPNWLRPLYSSRALVARIPAGLTKKDQTVSVVLTEYLAYQSKPLPEVIGQDEAQYLQYNSESTFPETAYPTKKLTIRFR